MKCSGRSDISFIKAGHGKINSQPAPAPALAPALALALAPALFSTPAPVITLFQNLLPVPYHIAGEKRQCGRIL
jgi:hypothetical protein